MPRKKRIEKQNDYLPTLLIYLAILSLAVIAIFMLFWQAIYDTMFSDWIDNNNGNVNSVALELGYDPLITAVPEEMQSQNAKSKFFISNSDPRLGSEQAKVVVVLWSRFDNQTAKQVSINVQKLKTEYKDDDIIIIWKDFVDPNDKESMAWQAALAAHCVSDQYNFWEYHDWLFNNIDDLNTEMIKNYALNLDLDSDIFNQCFNGLEPYALMQSNYFRAKSQDIEQVPVIYVNDEKIDQPENIDNIKNAINKKLADYES